MAVKVQSPIEPYNDSYKVVNAKNVGVGAENKPLDEVLNNLPSGGGGGGTVPPTAIDISGLDTDGTIVETYADGTSKTTTMEFDDKGNPTKVTDGNGNVTELTGFEMGGGGGGNITVDSELSLESENPVQNKVVTQEFKAFNEAIGDTNRRVSALESGGVGGGSGGVSSWNDLTDKPFGENEDGTVKQLDNKYLEPFEGITEEELLPTRVGQSSMSDLGIYAIPSDTTEEMFHRWHGNGDNPITGNVFVEFDGVTYECAQQRLAAMDNGMAVGNCTNFGGTGNNEPFIVTIMPDTDTNGVATGAYYWAIAVLTDTAPTEHTVRVFQPLGEPKYMLKEDHLPFDAIAAYIDNYIDEALGGDY